MNSFIAALFNPAVPFIRYALIAGILASASFGTVGSLVVVKRMSYIAGAISHASLAGLGLVLFLNETKDLAISPIVGAVSAALLAALVIARITRSGRERSDTVIGTVWAVGMGIGLLFVAKTPGYTDPMSYIFGNILLLQKSDLMLDHRSGCAGAGVGRVFLPRLPRGGFRRGICPDPRTEYEFLRNLPHHSDSLNCGTNGVDGWHSHGHCPADHSRRYQRYFHGQTLADDDRSHNSRHNPQFIGAIHQLQPEPPNRLHNHRSGGGGLSSTQRNQT